MMCRDQLILSSRSTLQPGRTPSPGCPGSRATPPPAPCWTQAIFSRGSSTCHTHTSPPSRCRKRILSSSRLSGMCCFLPVLLFLRHNVISLVERNAHKTCDQGWTYDNISVFNTISSEVGCASYFGYVFQIASFLQHFYLIY